MPTVRLTGGLEACVNQLVFTLTDSTSADAWRGITPERAQSIKTTLDVARATLAGGAREQIIRNGIEAAKLAGGAA